MNINKMTLGDVETVYQLGENEDAFAIHQGHLFWTRNQLSHWVEIDQDVLLVAVDDEKVIGFVLSQLHRPTGKAVIENVFVKKEFRGRLVGERLIIECVLQLKARGAIYVCLYVNAKNQREISYFGRLGFEQAPNFAWLGKFL